MTNDPTLVLADSIINEPRTLGSAELARRHVDALRSAGYVIKPLHADDTCSGGAVQTIGEPCSKCAGAAACPYEAPTRCRICGLHSVDPCHNATNAHFACLQLHEADYFEHPELDAIGVDNSHQT